MFLCADKFISNKSVERMSTDGDEPWSSHRLARPKGVLLSLLLLIKNVFRVMFNRNCYKGTVHKLKS